MAHIYQNGSSVNEEAKLNRYVSLDGFIPTTLTALNLVRQHQRNLADYSRQALPFYNGVLANDDYKAKLAGSNLDEATLTTMQSGFKKLETLDKAHTAEMGEAQEATAARDKAWDAQEDWMRIFYRKAKIALKKAPQLREKLGMIKW
jgi:soluble cytochrome b562